MKQRKRILKFMDLLSKFKIDKSIDELIPIFQRAAKLLNMDRIILYKKKSKNTATIVTIFSSMKKEKYYSGEIINIKNNINLLIAFNKNTISSIPIPDIGEDIALPIMNGSYVITGDDISKARNTSEIDHIYFEFLAKATENSLNIFMNKIRIEKLLKQAYTDKLTGSLNRAALDKHIDENKKIDDTNYKNLAETVIFIDIDHFKIFNDTYGHDAGDEVLKQVFSTLKSKLNKNSIIYRYGGEEISIIVIEGNALKIAEQCRKSIEVMIVKWKNKDLKVTISIGVANNNNLGIASRYADHALYYSKENGRNKVTEHNDGIEEWFKKRK